MLINVDMGYQRKSKSQRKVRIVLKYVYFFVFFFKQKTAYEILTCDWSSDVCSSDLVLMAFFCFLLFSVSKYSILGIILLGAAERGLLLPDRKSVVQGKSVDLGGRRIIKKKKKKYIHRTSLLILNTLSFLPYTIL